MAFTNTVSQICILLATVCGVVFSQAPVGPGDPNLFSSLVSSMPSQTGPNDLSSLLGGGTVPQAPAPTGFAPVTGTNSMPPSMGFPTMTGGFGGGNFGGTNMGGFQPPRPQAPPPQNPMSGLMPYLFLGGSDWGQRMMMAQMFGGNGAGAGGGLMSNPLALMTFANMF